MLRVLTKVACYIEGAWHAAGTEIVIAEKHFHDSVHTLIEEIEGKEPAVVPAATGGAVVEQPAAEAAPAPAASEEK